MMKIRLILKKFGFIPTLSDICITILSASNNSRKDKKEIITKWPFKPFTKVFPLNVQMFYYDFSY